jgi:HAD superfamily hydrolase (TIGR01509 family)
MVKAVIFDLGKVLVDFDYSVAADHISGKCSMSGEELYLYMARSPLIVQYETGLISSQQFFDGVRKASGYSGTFEEFAAFFGDIFTPLPVMIELHAELRRRGMPTYIFSNTNDMAVRHIERSYPFFKTFTGYIYSYEHRSMKPDSKLYEVVEQVSGHRGADLLYIDDRPENIAAGAARGWQTILQEQPETTRAAVARLGLLS